MKRVSLLYLVLYFHKTHRDEIFLKSHLSVNVPENKKLQELPQKTHRWACRQLCEPNLWTKAPLKWIPNPWTLCARATVAQARGEGRGGLPWHALTPIPSPKCSSSFPGVWEGASGLPKEACDLWPTEKPKSWISSPSSLHYTVPSAHSMASLDLFLILLKVFLSRVQPVIPKLVIIPSGRGFCP